MYVWKRQGCSCSDKKTLRDQSVNVIGYVTSSALDSGLDSCLYTAAHRQSWVWEMCRSYIMTTLEKGEK